MTALASLVVVSDTELITRERCWEKHPQAWAALLDWCCRHGIDPHAIPVTNRIIRDVERCRVEYDGIVTDVDGKRLITDDGLVLRRMYVQGETPPMPWPFEAVDWR